MLLGAHWRRSPAVTLTPEQQSLALFPCGTIKGPSTKTSWSPAPEAGGRMPCDGPPSLSSVPSVPLAGQNPPVGPDAVFYFPNISLCSLSPRPQLEGLLLPARPQLCVLLVEANLSVHSFTHSQEGPCRPILGHTLHCALGRTRQAPDLLVISGACCVTHQVCRL